MPQVRVGIVPFTAGQQAQPLRVAVADPIDELELIYSGVITVPAGGCTWLEDQMLRVLRRIQMTIGGRPFKVIGDNSVFASGGRLLSHFTPLLYASRPLRNLAAATEGSNAFSYSMKIPFTMPPALSKKIRRRDRQATVLKTGGEDIDLVVDWGTIVDATATANVAIASANIEVIAHTDPSLAKLETSLALFKENTQQLAILAGANNAEELDLNRAGMEPYMLLWNIDDSLQDDAAINRLQIKANVTDVLADMSWLATQAVMQDAVGRQIAPDVGVSGILFDEGEDGESFLPAGDVALVRKLAAIVDHDALTATFRLIAHHYYIEVLRG